MNRYTLLEKTENFDDFSTSLSERIDKLTRHYYISKSQGIFLQNLKSNLLINEVTILLDFSESFSFIIQGEARDFYWERSQCALRPFVVHHEKSDDDEITHKSFCFLFINTKHHTSIMYTFISSLLPKIKCFIPQLNKIYYYCNGCAGQYKNRFNFINLCYHKMDFNVECEWHFFATSHRKTACDGIAEMVKKMTAKARLQRPFENQILTF